MLNISHNDMHMQQSLSLLLPLNEEQQKLQIQKWINELLTISGKESEQKDTEQKNISHEFLIQKLSTILNKCFTDPDDEIEILKELSEELSSINIQILWEEKSVLDRSTGEVLSFDEIYRD
jgi:hypothetical protein